MNHLPHCQHIIAFDRRTNLTNAEFVKNYRQYVEWSSRLTTAETTIHLKRLRTTDVSGPINLETRAANRMDLNASISRNLEPKVPQLSGTGLCRATRRLPSR